MKLAYESDENTFVLWEVPMARYLSVESEPVVICCYQCRRRIRVCDLRQDHGVDVPWVLDSPVSAT